MAQRAFPQPSRKNVLRVFADLLRPGARGDFSTGALTRAGFGQARHAHALLTYLGFLEGGQPTQEVQTRRKNLRDFADWLRRAVCESYAPRLGDMAFLFDEPNQEQARSLARQRVEAASQKSARPLHKRNIAQVVDCLLALREMHRLLSAGRRDWMDEASPATEDAPAAEHALHGFLDEPATVPFSGNGSAGPSDRTGADGAVDAAASNGSPHAEAGSGGSGDLVSRLADRLSSSSRRIEFHAKHVQIQDGVHTSYTLADVEITIQ